jgi:hypothetical protein
MAGYVASRCHSASLLRLLEQPPNLQDLCLHRLSREKGVSPAAALPPYLNADNFQASSLLRLAGAWSLFRAGLSIRVRGARDLSSRKRLGPPVTRGELEFAVHEETDREGGDLWCTIVLYAPAAPGVAELRGALAEVLERGMIGEKVLAGGPRIAGACLDLAFSLRLLADDHGEVIHLSARDAHAIGPRGARRFECRQRRGCPCRCALLQAPYAPLDTADPRSMLGLVLAPVEGTLRRMRGRASECLRDCLRGSNYGDLGERHPGCDFHRAPRCDCFDCYIALYVIRAKE